MEQSCARAVELGLPAIAFTEHLDHTVWTVALDALDGNDHLALATTDGKLTPPTLDVTGYLNEIERCRERYAGLQIMSGLELGEPHWHAEATARVLGAGEFDRILGSLHCLPDNDGFAEPPGLYGHRAADDVVRTYLTAVADLVTASDAFSVLAHIDYPVRSWPTGTAGPFDPRAFEDEFRHALRTTAECDKALEVSTVVPLHAVVLRWWHEEGGDAITFASDAHDPSQVAHGFRDAAAMAEAHGFRSGSDACDFWGRAN
jgi:histidinol-phosphatase (PHP family)